MRALRFHRRVRRDAIHRPAPYGFTGAELLAWLDAVCALQIFRVDAGQGGEVVWRAGLAAPHLVTGASQS